MAVQSSATLLLLLLLSATMSLIPAATEVDDMAALLTFKAAATRGGPGDALASWNSSSVGGFCSWEGVTCGSRYRRVVALSLPSHGLAGVLSPAIGNLSFLRTLNLSKNGFNGNVPASLGRLRHLQALNLSYNAFSGELPVNLSSCTSLTIMVLQSNNLQGYIPPDLGDNLAHLKSLQLRENSLIGTIPASLANLSSLSILDLASNQLDGAIPPSLGRIIGLQVLNLAINNLSGEFPDSLYNLSSLQVLKILSNMIHGSIPADIGSRFPNMWLFTFARNSFTGTIPSSFSNLTSLQALDLSVNMFSGYVPPTLGRLPALQGLYLYSNMLETDKMQLRELITSLSNCSELQLLMLNDNAGLAGQLPSSVVNLSTSLHVLRFDYTSISGTIPSAISNLVNLQVFIVGATYISGLIPKSIGELTNLGWLGLYQTNLSGQIPSSIGNLSNLVSLHAHDSNLEGPIPQSMNNIKGLSSLNLSLNRLSGSIPDAIGSIYNLQQLYLAYNNLSGPIPSVLSISGNNELCGGIPQLHLAPCQMDSHALANGTNGFDEANLLGKGSFGAVYKCMFQDEGTIVAVKVFNLEQVGSTRSFVAECEALRRVRHRRLMKIITCCSSTNHQGQEFKALVFEYMPNGSLNDWLHPETRTQTNTLSLKQRLGIAVDIIDAMDYLHNHCQPPVVHCDLKPSNILLAEDMSARIGDFGISRILPESACITLMFSTPLVVEQRVTTDLLSL